MNRVVTAVTKIRPIKKLFIIERDDLSRFTAIIKSLSQEIAGISNLILLNDDSLLNKKIITFVNWHNPDVIINYSSRSSEELRRTFKLPTYKEGDDRKLHNLSTPLFIFDNPPLILQLLGSPEECSGPMKLDRIHALSSEGG